MGNTIYWVLFFLATPTIAFSQPSQKPVYAQAAQGKADSNTAWISKKVDAVKQLSRGSAASLKRSLYAQVKSFYQMPQLNPPLGFTTKTFLTISYANANGRSIPNTAVSLVNHYLIDDPKTGGVKVSDGNVLVIFETNSIEHFCHQQGSFWHDCNELNIPEFFEEIPVTDSTADYIEINYRYYRHPHSIPPNPMRIVRRNNKPVFIPFTRKNYMQYLVAKSTFRAKTWKDIITDTEKNIKEARNNVANPAYSQVKDALSASLKTMERQVADAHDKVRNAEADCQRFIRLMNEMPAEEASAPARVTGNGGIGSLESLVAPGRQEGETLYRVNPDYFDMSPGAPGAQVIIVYYTWEQLGPYVHDPDYLQQKMMKLFNEIDYHQLKESMQ